ncbi:DUF927 domain-containing phage anti-repressor protein AntA [Yersinia pseudotuberculosis]|uniref:Conserved domain protein n=1 Tax=Yersinia pseudotuberculosis serotype O:1b (strain IP 31758) TaxID=349747 RepID=A0A0U1QXB4_YERP3|nr:conserved domain protein [Yersinia pseudotuberculosis IP 31758]UFA63805.1 DUF927 domain-containing phage anti-repressor protein AntA [Yersinia pseudotuberculosis]CNI15640.1 AntA/AntB antirepressor domain-containing protein [Yersinia pseudotuberculosis]
MILTTPVDSQKQAFPLAGSIQTQPESSQSDISSSDFAERIPVSISNIGNKDIQSVSGRKLHVFLKVGRDFTTWIKARIKQYGFKEGVDYVIVEDLSTPVSGSAKSRQQVEHDYVLSLDMGKELSMVERNEQGKAARRYFIDCEERLRRVAPEEYSAALMDWRKNRVAACEDHKSMSEAVADIGEREGWRTLKAGGVNVTTKSTLRAILADWLQRSGSLEIWRVAQATGWQCGAYIMPDGEIIGTPEKPVLFNGRSAAAAGYVVKGTPESWRDSVARLARGNPSMMAGIGAALAAPLIGLAGADGFGIHFYEQSSSGKTTTANIASSLYGEPDALRLTWFGTALGIANEAAAHNDGLMPLDEVGQGADPDSVANPTGKRTRLSA